MNLGLTSLGSQIYSYGILVAVGAAFVVFTLKERIVGKQVSARIQKQGSSPLLGALPMEFAYWCLRPLGKTAAALKISPNIFSWLCLTFGVLSGFAAAVGRISLAGGLAIISAVCDALDGMVARTRGVASDAGEVLDAAVDRYAEFFLLGGLVIYYRFSPGLMALTLAALLGSLMVSYSQAKADAMNVEIPKGWMRRPERAAYLGLGAFIGPLFVDYFEPLTFTPAHYPMVAALLVVAVFANMSAIIRYRVMYQVIKAREASSETISSEANTRNV